MKAIYTITIGVGQTANGHDIAPAHYDHAFAVVTRDAAKLFSGYTLTHGQGGWFDSRLGILIEEPIINVTLITDAGREAVETFARWAGQQFEQHSVVLTHGYQATFVPCE